MIVKLTMGALTAVRGGVIVRLVVWHKNMIRSILSLLLMPALSFAQTEKKISGRIINVFSDTLIILPDRDIPPKFYEIEETRSKIENEEFMVDVNAAYPQLLYTLFTRDRGYVLNRPKAFFIDNTSTAIFIDTANWESSYVKGDAGDEFEQQFTPFISENLLKNERYSLYSMPFVKDVKIDTALYNYSRLHPDSFIPLWFLIKRYYQFGHSALRENHLGQFSDEVKDSKIWKLLQEDMDRALLKQGSTFPTMKLLDSNLESYSLKDNQGKYFLLDFWFTSCKPCIQALPRLNNIYERFHKNGLEIISISVDRDRAVEKWRSRILEKDMPWKHCLDPDGLKSNELFVKNFPRYILLDANWNVVNMDISLDELEAYLDYYL